MVEVIWLVTSEFPSNQVIFAGGRQSFVRQVMFILLPSTTADCNGDRVTVDTGTICREKKKSICVLLWGLRQRKNIKDECKCVWMRMLKFQNNSSLPWIKIVALEFETTRFSVRAQKIIWLWTGASNVNLNVQGSSKLHSIVTNCVWFTQYLKSPPPVPSSICLPLSPTV